MILAIDTATRWTGLAVHDGFTVLAEVGWYAINRQTVELAPAVAEILARTGVGPPDLKALAVTLGPGSYTGLRVGMGFAKGMALAYRTPLIGIGTLDVVAAAFGRGSSSLVAVAEAGRGRVCAGVYAWHERFGWQATAAPEIETWEQLLGRLDGPATFAGEISAEAHKRIRAAGKGFQAVGAAAGVRRAGYLAELGWRRWRSQKLDDPAALTPIYLREPTGQKSP